VDEGSFEYMNDFLLEHVKKMLEIGKELVVKSPLLDSEIGTVNAKGDHTIAMDKAVEDALIEYIKSNNIPANIFSEEIGEIKFHDNPKYFIAFDPLDGSTNYKIGKNLYPYGLLIAIYDGLESKLSQVIASGAIEYSRNLSWTFFDNKTFDKNDKQVKLKNDWSLDRHTPIFLDLYYKSGYELYRSLAEKLFIRNIGSTIGNLSYVLSNIASGLGGVCMRPEEIGAIYSLIKGAGGITLDHSGNDIGDRIFSSKDTYQILAGSEKAIEYAVKQLK
jgi:fructose-1,6-bisphosphatase/inositol monophosphatase family enzyme